MKKIITILLFLISSNLYARYLSRDDFSFITQEHNNRIIVNNDGTREVYTRLKLKIAKEKARKQLAVYPIVYNATSSKIQIIHAEVVNGKKKYKVSPKNIVDTSITQSIHGFDAINIIKIALPNLKVGSIINIEYKEETKEEILKNHFSINLLFGIGGFIEKSKTEIISDRKIHYVVNDPWKVLKVESRKDKKGKNIFSIQQKRPFGNLSTIQSIQVEGKKLTFVLASTDKDWNKVMKDIKLAYEKVIDKPLPPTLKNIAKETIKKSNLKEKVNYAVSQIIKEFNYVGDWRTVRGQLIPKGFQELEKTKYGDCKDFSSALTAILKKAGVDASVAWVFRSSLAIKNYYDTDLVFPKAFNHAIVYIKDGKEEYWIDPTNSYANGLLINDDISFSEAVILGKTEIKATKIPLVDGKKHFNSLEKTYDFKNLKDISVSGKMKFTGRYSAELVALSKKENKEKVKERIIEIASFGGEHQAFVKVEPFKLDNFVNENLDISFKYKSKDIIKNRFNQNLIVFPMNNFNSLIEADTKSKITNTFLGNPGIANIKLTYKGIHFVGDKMPSCDIKTKWLDFKIDVNQTADAIVYNKEFVIKKPVILQTEFDSTDYKLLVSGLYRCIKKSYIQVKLGKGGKKNKIKKLSLLFKKLPLKKRVEKRKAIAIKLLENRGVNLDSQYTFEDAYKLLQLNLQEAPSDERSYTLMATVILNLSRNYFPSNNRTEVEKVINSGIEKLGRTPYLLLSKASIQYSINKNKNNALRILQEAEKKRKKRDMKFLDRLSSVYSKLKEEKRYLSVINEMKERSKKEKLPNRFWFWIAFFYDSVENWGKCIEYYNTYLKKNTNDRFAYNNLANCQDSIGKSDDAISSYKKALALGPFAGAEDGLAKTYINKADRLIKKKKYDKAKESIEQGLAIRPLQKAYTNLAMINFLQGDVKKGLSNLKKYRDMSNKYIKKVDIFYEILMSARKIDNNVVQKVSEKLIETSGNESADIKLSVAFIIIADFFNKKDYDMEKIDKHFAVIQKIEKENTVLVKEDKVSKITLALSYLWVGIMKNDILLYEKAIKLIDALEVEREEKKKYIASVVRYINHIDRKIGRKPASFFWENKKKVHIFLQRNFKVNLINLNRYHSKKD